MFWKFLIAIILGFFFIKFGMMTAVMPLLAGGLQITLVVLMLLGVVFIYNSLKK